MTLRATLVLLLLPTALWAQEPKAEKALQKGCILVGQGKGKSALKQLEKAASDPVLRQQPQVNLLIAEAHLLMVEGEAKASSDGLGRLEKARAHLDFACPDDACGDSQRKLNQRLNKRLIGWSEAALRDKDLGQFMRLSDQVDIEAIWDPDRADYYYLRIIAFQQLGDPKGELDALTSMVWWKQQAGDENVYLRWFQLCEITESDPQARSLCQLNAAEQAVQAGFEDFRPELARLQYMQRPAGCIHNQLAVDNYVKLREGRLDDDTLYARELLFAAYQVRDFRRAAEAAESLKMGGVSDTTVLRAGGNAYWHLSEQTIKEDQEYSITAMGWDSGAMYNYERLHAQTADPVVKERLRTIYIRLRERQKLYDLTGETVSRSTGKVTGP